VRRELPVSLWMTGQACGPEVFKRPISVGMPVDKARQRGGDVQRSDGGKTHTHHFVPLGRVALTSRPELASCPDTARRDQRSTFFFPHVLRAAAGEWACKPGSVPRILGDGHVSWVLPCGSASARPTRKHPCGPQDRTRSGHEPQLPRGLENRWDGP
jgi:hypothetical protein